MSSLTVCAPGTVFTGPSFTELTVIATVSSPCAVPSLGGDRERVGAVEVGVALVAEGGERGVDLRLRARQRQGRGAVRRADRRAAARLTFSVPLVTVSVVVSAGPSTSATETPAIDSAVSSLTVCAPGTVFTGPSFTVIDLDQRKRARGRGAVVDRHQDETVCGSGASPGLLERDQGERCVIVGAGRGAAQRELVAVDDGRDSAWERASHHQGIARLGIEQDEGRAHKVRAVDIGEHEVDVGERNRRAVLGERRDIA